MKKENLRVLKSKVFSDCNPENAFWACNGDILRNLYELLNHIKKTDEWTFKYHVNDDNQKNDFAKWVRDVFSDNKLADELESVKDKNRYIQILQRRIRQLEAA